MDTDYPCPIESIISFKLSFDNLKVFLEFLDKKNKKNQLQINDIYVKLKEIDEIKGEISEINNNFTAMQKLQEDMNFTLNYHGNKLLEFEKNNIDMEEVYSF